MAKVNEDFLKLSGGYLFPEIARRTKKWQEKNPGAKVLREYEKNGDYKVDMEIDKEEVGEKNLQKVGIDRQKRLKMETDLKNKIEEIVQLIEKRMGEKGIKVMKCYMTNKPNNIVHIDEKDDRTLQKIKLSIEELKKMLHEYEKIGVYYYNDNKTDLDKLCAHCEKLSSKCWKKIERAPFHSFSPYRGLPAEPQIRERCIVRKLLRLPLQIDAGFALLLAQYCRIRPIFAESAPYLQEYNG